MKRQALGKGLSSLIPDPKGMDALTASGMPAVKAGTNKGEMSAADTKGSAPGRPLPQAQGKGASARSSVAPRHAAGATQDVTDSDLMSAADAGTVSVPAPGIGGGEDAPVVPASPTVRAEAPTGIRGGGPAMGRGRGQAAAPSPNPASTRWPAASRGGQLAPPPSPASQGRPAPDREGAEQTPDRAVAPPQAIATGVGSGALQWIDVDLIRPNPQQPRRSFPEAEIDELTASIRASGILQPVIVRRLETGFGLVAGERRWRAARRAGLLRVPAIVREVPEDRLVELALIENIQRQDLNAIEEARAYASLIEDHGLSQGEVADRVGKQRPTITNTLRLLVLPDSVQKMVETGALSSGHARALVGLPGPRAQELGAAIVAKLGLSVRETEAWVARHTDDPQPERLAGPLPDPNTRAAEENLQRRLGTKVRIAKGRAGKGRIQIEYFSESELDRLYERLIRA